MADENAVSHWYGRFAFILFMLADLVMVVFLITALFIAPFSIMLYFILLGGLLPLIFFTASMANKLLYHITYKDGLLHQRMGLWFKQVSDVNLRDVVRIQPNIII